MARRSRKVLRSKRKPQKQLSRSKSKSKSSQKKKKEPKGWQPIQTEPDDISKYDFVKQKSKSKSKSKSVVRKPKVSKLGIPVKKSQWTKKKKKGPSPYNLFVKKMSPVLRKANPGMRQPSIMKLIAKEWKKSPHGSLTKI